MELYKRMTSGLITDFSPIKTDEKKHFQRKTVNVQFHTQIIYPSRVTAK